MLETIRYNKVDPVIIYKSLALA